MTEPKHINKRVKGSTYIWILGIVIFIIIVNIVGKYIWTKFVMGLPNVQHHYAMTKEIDSDTYHYYEIYNRFKKKEVEQFDADITLQYTITGAYTYPKRENNETHRESKNEVNMKYCTIIDIWGKKVEVTEELKNIINLAENIEHHVSALMIYCNADDYYVVAEINAGLSSPFTLYEYSKEKSELKYIYNFSGFVETIQAIKK